MRFVVGAALLLLLNGCAGTQIYTPQDVQQVHQAYAMLRPTYLAFKQVYEIGDKALVLKDYAREQRQCRLVDEIDNRDSIDPSTNLFAASVVLDGFCNTIESAYAWWAKNHGYPYNPNLVPDLAGEVFVASDYDLQKIVFYLRHPKSLTIALTVTPIVGPGLTPGLVQPTPVPTPATPAPAG
jgi:hypothetical protein